MFKPRSRMEKFDHENDAIIIINSPNRLIVGGSARLARLAVNHQVTY